MKLDKHPDWDYDWAPPLPLVIICGGGHAKVLYEAVLRQRGTVLGFTDIRPDAPLSRVYEAPKHLGDEWTWVDLDPTEVMLVNGLGSIESPVARERMWLRAKACRPGGREPFRFARVIHPSAVLGQGASLGEGVQVLAGAVVQSDVRLEDDVIINTRASVDHDCWIGAHCHIAPGVTLSGNVQVGSRTHIGTGATVIQGVHIGSNVTIGAGAVVVRDVPSGTKVMGVPARPR